MISANQISAPKNYDNYLPGDLPFPNGREQYSNSIVSDSDQSLFIVDDDFEDDYGEDTSNMLFTIQ
jgi:hypothetical protein